MKRDPTPFALAGSVALAALVALFVFIGPPPRRPSAEALRAGLGSVPAFTLINEKWQPYGTEDLAGRPWITGFFFTRCRGMCPMLIQRMQELSRRLPTTHLVSISVDPDHDTPDVLAVYADSLGVDPRGWSFLTGGRETVLPLVVEGFHLAAGTAPPDAAEPILHSSKLVLVDKDGLILGYYDALDEADMERLVADARRLPPAES